VGKITKWTGEYLGMVEKCGKEIDLSFSFEIYTRYNFNFLVNLENDESLLLIISNKTIANRILLY
jgi:hypothetical protein